jgi:hypothetical protein
MEAGQYAPAVAAIKEKGILSGKRVERSERGAPGHRAPVAVWCRDSLSLSDWDGPRWRGLRAHQRQGPISISWLGLRLSRCRSRLRAAVWLRRAAVRGFGAAAICWYSNALGSEYQDTALTEERCSSC